MPMPERSAALNPERQTMLTATELADLLKVSRCQVDRRQLSSLIQRLRHAPGDRAHGRLRGECGAGNPEGLEVSIVIPTGPSRPNASRPPPGRRRRPERPHRPRRNRPRPRKEAQRPSRRIDPRRRRRGTPPGQRDRAPGDSADRRPTCRGKSAHRSSKPMHNGSARGMISKENANAPRTGSPHRSNVHADSGPPSTASRSAVP